MKDVKRGKINLILERIRDVKRGKSNFYIRKGLGMSGAGSDFRLRFAHPAGLSTTRGRVHAS